MKHYIDISSLASSCTDRTDFFVSLSLSLSHHPSPTADSLHGIQCLHRIDECKFLLVDQH